MRILYLAKHESGGGDDEGAISHSLELLGHTVIKVHERHGRRDILKIKADLCLTHKYDEIDVLNRLKMPKVFYYFDLVEYPDQTLESRNRARRNWMSRVIPHVDIGFLTDGDWVEKYNGRCFGGTKEGHRDKLVWLNQGADVRVIGPGKPRPGPQEPLLFTGIWKGAGTERKHFVDTLSHRYAFLRCVEKGLYGRALADQIASTQVVLAPSGPVTPVYWSNRVYNVLGFQGFLLHPYCAKLAEQYKDGEEIVFYQDHEDLFSKINWYLERPEDRHRIASGGYIRTLAAHTYVHRCAQLLRIVKETLNVPAYS